MCSPFHNLPGWRRNSEKDHRAFAWRRICAPHAPCFVGPKELGFQCGLKRTYIGALERKEVNPGIDNLDKLAVGVGVLAHVLLLSPELAYAEIYGAFSSTSEAAH